MTKDPLQVYREARQAQFEKEQAMLYAFRFPKADPNRDDPHAVQIMLSRKDRLTLHDVPKGAWVGVTDQNTGKPWHVRRASCGSQACFCAAEARPKVQP